MADPASQAFLQVAADYDENQLTRYRRFGDYYEGRQNAYLKDRNRRYMQRSGWEFSENFSEVVVDVFAERLSMTGMILENKTDEVDLSSAGEWLDGMLQYNRLDAKQLTVYTNALIKGDAYLIVDWDPNRSCPRLTYNAPERIKPVYSVDEPDQLVYVVKRWYSAQVGPSNPNSKSVARMNLYFPDRVEKYFKLSNDEQSGWTEEAFWRPWTDEGDPGWPIPWVSDGVPLGIPVVHFRHKHLGGGMGTSELRSVVSQQDLLNKMVIDMAEIFDYMAWPQRWIKGPPVDAVNLRPAPGEYLTLPSEDFEVGQFDAADLSSVSEAVEEQLSRLARRSRTPLHLLTGGTPPSGEALKTSESGLVAKCKSAQMVFGQSWEDVALLMLRLGAANNALPQSVDLDGVVAQAQWMSPETRDDLGDAQYAQTLHSEGLASKRTLQAGLGLDPDVELDNMERESSTLDQAAGRLLDAGGAGNGYVSDAVPNG